MRITFDTGAHLTCRFVRRGIDRQTGMAWWYVDHGAYGVLRDDSYIKEDRIATVEPAPKPTISLSVQSPIDHKVRRAGWYASRDEAEPHAAIMRPMSAAVIVTEAAP